MLRILVLAAAIAVPLVAATPGDAVGSDPRTSAVAVTAIGAGAPGGPMSGDPVPTDTVPTDTANPFLPEERDLTDCLGLLQRPGCGSEARGGLGQTLVAIAMVGGLVLIFGRVAWGVRRNRARQALPADADTADTAGTDSEGAADDGSENGPAGEAAGGSAGDQSDGGTVDTAPRGDAS